MTKRYEMSRLYRARTQYHHWDDSTLEDEWQLEVYLHALELMKGNNFESVTDVGCGSGYKLVTYLGEYQTLGLELPVNVELLRTKYPERDWQVSDFSAEPRMTTDVVICADVIEHLVDPDELLHFIKKIPHKYLVLSTPDRRLLHQPWRRRYYGPPVNMAHVREWTFNEFGAYISKHFDVVEHTISNAKQWTQMITCTPR